MASDTSDIERRIVDRRGSINLALVRGVVHNALRLASLVVDRSRHGSLVKAGVGRIWPG